MDFVTSPILDDGNAAVPVVGEDEDDDDGWDDGREEDKYCSKCILLFLSLSKLV